MILKLTNQTIDTFLDALANTEPTPGGGSTAALQGALAASLIEMVAAASTKKKGLEAHIPRLQAIADSAKQWRSRLQEGINEDATAYTLVVSAYRLPKETDPQKTARSEAIQSALKEAASVPLENARACATLLPLAIELTQIGNPNMITDAAVAAQAALAGAHGALLNVVINLDGIKDEDWRSSVAGEVSSLQSQLGVEAHSLNEAIRAITQEKVAT